MRFVKDRENSNNITLYTLQDRSVLDKLKNNEVYVADYRNIFATNYISQYKRLANLYNFENCPIFCATNESKGIIDSSNLNKNNKVLLKLSVPRNMIKKHNYYDWTDYLYFDSLDAWDESDISKDELEKLIQNQTADDADSTQVVIDRIEPEWLVEEVR